MERFILIVFCIFTFHVCDLQAIRNGRRVDMLPPYQVAIFRNNYLRCGGSILREDRILTAAHCVKGYLASSIHITAGSALLKDRSGTGLNTYQLRRVQAILIKIHPRYNPINREYDVALIKLAESLDSRILWEQISIAPLRNNPHVGDKVIVRGWGVSEARSSAYEFNTEILREAVIQLKDDNICTRSFGGKKYNSDTMFCAIGENKANACDGDDGNPVMTQDGRYQIGIVSYISCEAEHPGYYAKITNTEIWNWIDKGRGLQWEGIQSLPQANYNG